MRKTYTVILALTLFLSLSANILLCREIQYLKDKREGQAQIIIDLMERERRAYEEIWRLQDKLDKYEPRNDTAISNNVHIENFEKYKDGCFISVNKNITTLVFDVKGYDIFIPGWTFEDFMWWLGAERREHS